MKNFFKRNTSVLVIGLATLIIFLAIIVLDQFRSVTHPNLIKLNDDQTTQIEQKEAADNAEKERLAELAQNPDKAKLDYAAIDKAYGTKEIEYTDQGFTPEQTRIYQGQKVVWKNATKQSIFLRQLMQTYKDWPEEVEIKPNETFEFRMYEIKLWTYQEKNSRATGSIFVTPAVTSTPESTTSNN